MGISGSEVTAVVLDAPVLDLSRTIEYAAEQLQLPVIGPPPTSLIWVAERIAGFRYHLDRDAVNYLHDPSWVRVPTLIFDGEEGDRAPVDSTQHLGRSNPKPITLVEIEGAGHVEAWNSNRSRTHANSPPS